MTTQEIILYCDGACLGNPGPGGYAALLMLKNNIKTERVVFGSEILTTNNRMELRGAIEGLRALTKPCKVTVFCDSQYVVRGMNEWINNWQASGFKNSRKQPVANSDLWQELVAASTPHTITWRWVKAHAGNVHNERVDEIAREQALLIAHEMK